jgi:glycosyltransferase involved in cell wall biosynthesis
MSLISVIIPVFNSEKTIYETVKSVLSQSLSDFEIIIIDDGSQDSTLEVIQRFQDFRIRVFSYANAGPSMSRNRGIAQATGEYITFIDADDLWTSNKLEAQLQALQSNPQAAVVYSWTDCIDETGQFIRAGSHITASGDVYGQLLLVNFIESGSNLMMRREALEQTGGFDASLKTAEDWDLWLRLAASYQFIGVPISQVLYRISSTSLSNHVLQMEADGLRMLRRAFEQKPVSPHLRSACLGNFYKYLICKTLDGTPNRKKAIQAIRLLGHAIAHDPLLLKSGVIWKILLKILTAILCPPVLIQPLMMRVGKVLDISTLYGYLKLNPS